MDYLQEIDQLLEQASYLGETVSHVELLESAIRIADSHQDINEGFELRQRLLMLLYYVGFPEKQLVAFSWCIAQHDRHPEQFTDWLPDTLWYYKWMTNILPRFSQFSRQQIDQTFTDMAERYRRNGSSQRPVYEHRLLAAINMGDSLEIAQAHYENWQSAIYDNLSDCEGCEVDLQVSYWIAQQDYEQALKEAQPIIQGRLWCSELPHMTLSNLLVPLVKLDRLDLAADFHLRSYPKVNKSRVFLLHSAGHLLFLTLTGNFNKAVGLFEDNLAIALDAMNEHAQFYFYRASYLLWESLQSERDTVTLRLPQGFVRYQPDGQYETQKLLSWFEQQLQDIAQRFDARNGSSTFADSIADLRSLAQYQTDFPLAQFKQTETQKPFNPLNQADVFEREGLS